VLIVPTTDGEAIEQYALRVAEAWKIGRKKIDDGALLVIAKNDRRLRIEVGYGLEGALTDATTKRIIDEDITPKFKAGDFGGGVVAGVDKMVRIVNGEKLPEPEPPHWQDSQSFDPSDLFNPFLIIPAIFFGGLLRSLMGRLLGSAAAGALTALIAWFMVGSALAAVIAGVIASLFVLISDGFTSAGRRAVGAALAVGPEAPAAHGPAAAARAAAAASVAAAAALAAAVHRGTGSMSIRRIGRHLLEHRWRLRRILPPQALARIEQAIKAGEATHSGTGAFRGGRRARRRAAVSQSARAGAGAGYFFAIADLGYRPQQWRPDLPAAGRPRFRDCCRSRHRRQGRPRRLGKNLRRDGSAVQGRKF
jgi:uncharacterized protein